MRRARAILLISFFLTYGANAQEAAQESQPLAPLRDWSGFYLGATAGAAFGDYRLQTTAQPGPAIDHASASALASQSAARVKPQGFAGGGEAGYNWQLGRFVIGAEADFQTLQLNATGNSGAIQSRTVPSVNFVARSNANTNWLLTARARAGILTANNWLLFATGGLAVTRFDSDIFFYDTRGYLEAGKLDDLKTGYAVGGGVEVPLTERVSVKAEYQYVHFGDTDARVTNNTYPVFGVPQSVANNGSLSASIVRAGFNYHFDNGALVGRHFSDGLAMAWAKRASALGLGGRGRHPSVVQLRSNRGAAATFQSDRQASNLTTYVYRPQCGFRRSLCAPRSFLRIFRKGIFGCRRYRPRPIVR